MAPSKDPSKPRGRVSAYAFFLQSCRAELKKKNPAEKVPFKEFSRRCSERWKVMTDEEKIRFKEMAQKDKIRYDAEMQTYAPSSPPAAKPAKAKATKGRGAGKAAKDPKAPKRPVAAFFWFSKANRLAVRAAHPDYSIGDVAKELGRLWGALSQDQKTPYERQALEDKARYEEELAEYKKTPSRAAGGTVAVEQDDGKSDEDDTDTDIED